MSIYTKVIDYQSKAAALTSNPEAYSKLRELDRSKKILDAAFQALLAEPNSQTLVALALKSTPPSESANHRFFKALVAAEEQKPMFAGMAETLKTPRVSMSIDQLSLITNLALADRNYSENLAQMPQEYRAYQAAKQALKQAVLAKGASKETVLAQLTQEAEKDNDHRFKALDKITHWLTPKN